MGASQSIRKSYEPYIPSTAFQTKLYPNSQLMGNSTYTKMRFETDPATGDNPNFNETNSFFYAPADGAYFFEGKILWAATQPRPTDSRIDLLFYVNGSSRDVGRHMFITDYANTYFFQSRAFGIFNLNQGDYVGLYLYHNMGGNRYTYEPASPSGWSSFGGFRISE